MREDQHVLQSLKGLCDSLGERIARLERVTSPSVAVAPFDDGRIQAALARLTEQVTLLADHLSLIEEVGSGPDIGDLRADLEILKCNVQSLTAEFAKSNVGIAAKKLSKDGTMYLEISIGGKPNLWVSVLKGVLVIQDAN